MLQKELWGEHLDFVFMHPDVRRDSVPLVFDDKGLVGLEYVSLHGNR